MADNKETVESLYPYSPTDSRARATWRKRIKTDMQKHEKAIKDLASQFNDLLPVGRLPPEILIKIFVEPSRIRHWDPVEPTRTRQRIRFAHVCRRWRVIALGCPTLWNTIDGHDDPDLMSWILSLSKQVSLNVEIAPPRRKTKRLSEATQRIWERILLEEMHRVSELYMKTLPAIQVTAPARRLKKLQIAMQHGDVLDPFSGILDGSDSPELRSMELHGPWPFALIPEVHHPHLRKFHCSIGDGTESLDGILALLDGMPLLESLSLTSCSTRIMVRSSGSRQHDRIAALVHLQKLSLEFENFEPVFVLLSHLDLPSTANIYVSGTFLGKPLTPITRLGSLLRSRYLSVSMHPSLAVTLILRDDDTATKQSETGGLKIQMSLEDEHLAIETICRALPLSRVEILTMDELSWGLDLANIVDMMPCLRTLRVNDSYLVPFLESLFLPDHLRDGAARDHVVRSLQVLEFIEMDFPPPNAREVVRRLRDSLVASRHGLHRGHAPRFEFDRIVYGDCSNLDAEMAGLLKGITGATGDNFG